MRTIALVSLLALASPALAADTDQVTYLDGRATAGTFAKGQTIQVAIFGISGPSSDPPTNFIWLRHARLDLVRAPAGPVPAVPTEVNLEVRSEGDGLHVLLGRNPKLHKPAQGFACTVRPVWRPETQDLLFSDPHGNTIYRYAADGTLEVCRHPSVYADLDIDAYRQPGYDGRALDRMNRLTIDEHGNRRVARLEADGAATVLADRFEGRRLNSPVEGHVCVSGPAGMHLFDAGGARLGTKVTPRHVHDMAWGDADGRSLYLCARDRLYRLRVTTPGAGFGLRPRPESTPQ